MFLRINIGFARAELARSAAALSRDLTVSVAAGQLDAAEIDTRLRLLPVTG